MRFATTVSLLAFALVTACAPVQETASPSPSPTQAPTLPPVTQEAVMRSAPPPAAPQPTPAAMATAAATPRVTAQPSAAPVAPASPSVAPATPQPAVVQEVAPNAPPRILSLQIDKTQVRPGDTVSGDVVTTSNVASVVARIATFSVAVPRVAPGRFALAYTVPRLPFFVRGHFQLQVIARNAAGAAASRTIDLLIR